MSHEIKGGGSFDYKELDATTADFLRTKETNMREIVGKAYTELGRELKEARDRMASHNKYEGVFGRWITYLGFSRNKANQLMQRYDLVINYDDMTQELLEDLPVSLTYDIAKPSAESTPAKAQAKAEVLAGEIDTGREYKERIAELEGKANQAEKTAEAERKSADAERKERERLEQENAELAEKADRPAEVRYETKTEYVEVRDETIEQRLASYEERFGDIRNYDESITASNTQDLTTATMSFNKAVREFSKRFSYMEQYADAIGRMDGTTKREYNEAVKVLHGLADSFKYLSDNDSIIINQ